MTREHGASFSATGDFSQGTGNSTTAWRWLGVLALGILGALAASRVLSGFLFGVTPNDPAVFVAVPALLGLVAIGACLIPARRAARVDPMVALRSE